MAASDAIQSDPPLGTQGRTKAAAPVDKLLEEFVPRVYCFAMRLTSDPHLAEDLTQETFLRAWRQRKILRDPAAARVWLFRILTNLWRDHLRRRKCLPEQANILERELAAPAASIERGVQERESLQLALAAMDRLPERQRQVLYLCACEDLSIAEAATALDISLEAVKSSLSLARKRMRTELSHLFDDASRKG